jgi:hypothetical protein
MTSNCHGQPLPLISLNTGAVQMIFKTHFFRWLAIPACVVAGLMELLALQRRKLLGRKPGLGA